MCYYILMVLQGSYFLRLFYHVRCQVMPLEGDPLKGPYYEWWAWIHYCPVYQMSVSYQILMYSDINGSSTIWYLCTEFMETPGISWTPVLWCVWPDLAGIHLHYHDLSHGLHFFLFLKIGIWAHNRICNTCIHGKIHLHHVYINLVPVFLTHCKAWFIATLWGWIHCLHHPIFLVQGGWQPHCCGIVVHAVNIFAHVLDTCLVNPLVGSSQRVKFYHHGWVDGFRRFM